MKTTLKQVCMFTAVLLMTPVTAQLAFAENKPAEADKAATATADAAKSDIDTDQATGWVNFATEIAQYGKAQQDAVALISAARILKESKVKEVPAAKGAKDATARPASEVIKEWLDEARKIADVSDNKDSKNKAEIVALADETGKKTRGYYTRHYYYRYHPVCY